MLQYLNQVQSQAAAASITVTPAGGPVPDNHIMLLALANDTNAMVYQSGLTGWTQVILATQNTAAMQMLFFKKKASSEPSSYTIVGTLASFAVKAHLVVWDPEGQDINIDDVVVSLLAPIDVTTGNTNTTAELVADGDAALSCTFINDGDRSTTTPPAGMTGATGTGTGDGMTINGFTELVSAGSLQRTIVWNGNDEMNCVAVLVPIPEVTGPTIIEDPQNGTAVLGDPDAALTSVTMTGVFIEGNDPIQSVTWKKDGVPISNGGIYAITTDIEAGTTELVITPTEVGDGGDYTFEVDDEVAAPVESDVAILTVLEGPVLTTPTTPTDGAGATTAELTSDFPLDADPAPPGSFNRVTIEAGGLTLTTGVDIVTP